jgi:superfamily I DNA and RNA helicase
MEKTFASARLKSDTRARDPITYLDDSENSLNIDTGTVYYDFPLFQDANERLHRAGVLLASRSHGVVLFAAIAPEDSAALSGADEDLSQLQSIIFGKCLQSKLLRRSHKELIFPVAGYLVAAGADVAFPNLENEAISALNQIPDHLATVKLREPISTDAWHELRAILEGTKAIIRPKPRVISQASKSAPNSKPAILAELENEIANFDANQRRAAISIVNGPQRIRGLAGSGKTVVLAMKAAHIHLNDPDAHVLFTFYTKSLYDFIRRLITRFYRQFNDRDPDWSKVHVRHAWGGRGMGGVYYDACIANGQQPLTLRSVMNKANPFDHVCDQLLSAGSLKQAYDYVLMDEAQDFPPAFYKLCFSLVRGGELDRNVIWAYDELQNIINVKVASPVEIFGTNAKNVPLMDLQRAAASSQEGTSHDIVLYKSYRNPREILICAHALGFGMYSDTMVQTLENKEHWEDLGYQVENGTFDVGSRVTIIRPEANSPLVISRRQSPSELIEVFVADSIENEANWIVTSIQGLLGEGLDASDIMVICLDDRNARGYFKSISEGLDAHAIRVNNLLADPYGVPRFYIQDHVTLTTVYRAKGNETAVVFAIGIDAIYPNRKQQQARNKLFTAFTRAKGWLRISGIGGGATQFKNEIGRAKELMPRMRFVQPDPSQIMTLQRDLSDKESKLRRLQEQIDQQFDALDIDPEEREAFLVGLRKKR